MGQASKRQVNVAKRGGWSRPQFIWDYDSIVEAYGAEVII